MPPRLISIFRAASSPRNAAQCGDARRISAQSAYYCRISQGPAAFLMFNWCCGGLYHHCITRNDPLSPRLRGSQVL